MQGRFGSSSGPSRRAGQRADPRAEVSEGGIPGPTRSSSAARPTTSSSDRGRGLAAGSSERTIRSSSCVSRAGARTSRSTATRTSPNLRTRSPTAARRRTRSTTGDRVPRRLAERLWASRAAVELRRHPDRRRGRIRSSRDEHADPRRRSHVLHSPNNWSSSPTSPGRSPDRAGLPDAVRHVPAEPATKVVPVVIRLATSTRLGGPRAGARARAAGDDPVPDKGYIVGHFIKYVEALGTRRRRRPSRATSTRFGSCIAVLDRVRRSRSQGNSLRRFCRPGEGRSRSARRPARAAAAPRVPAPVPRERQRSTTP